MAAPTRRISASTVVAEGGVGMGSTAAGVGFGLADGVEVEIGVAIDAGRRGAFGVGTVVLIAAGVVVGIVVRKGVATIAAEGVGASELGNGESSRGTSGGAATLGS